MPRSPAVFRTSTATADKISSHSLSTSPSSRRCGSWQRADSTSASTSTSGASRATAVLRRSADLDLSGRLKLRLDDLRLGQLSQFAGDFDGDGRSDFVQMGRGRNVSIHRGQESCRYPAEPDLVLKLAEAPQDLALVRVGDYDGDDRSDLIIIQPGEAIKDGSSSPVRLDLYLSAGGRFVMRTLGLPLRARDPPGPRAAGRARPSSRSAAKLCASNTSRARTPHSGGSSFPADSRPAQSSALRPATKITPPASSS